MRIVIWTCGLLLTVAGCKDLNDNPPPESGQTMQINVADLAAQISATPGLTENRSIGDRSGSVTSSDTDVSSEAKTLLVGAIVVTGRSTPYPDDITPTKSIHRLQHTAGTCK